MTKIQTPIVVVEEKAKRGRPAIQHADIMARIANPNPFDRAFLAFINRVYGVLYDDGMKISILARHSKVKEYFTASDEYKNAEAEKLEMIRAAEEAKAAADAAKVAAEVAKNAAVMEALIASMSDEMKASLLASLSK